jgi:DNA ligase (NAD+)
VQLEKEFPDLISSNSPTQRVGGQPVKEFPSVCHVPPMLSLDKTYSEGELREFDDRVRDVADIYSLTVEQLVRLERMGEKSRQEAR